MTGQTAPSLAVAGNEESYRLVSRLVAERFLGCDGSMSKIRMTPLRTNYYSFGFSLGIEGAALGRQVHVKIPKAAIGKAAILPIGEEDRRLAEDEYQSLVHLARSWAADDLGVRFVRPVGLIPEYNAIVTEKVDGEDLLQAARQSDPWVQLGGSPRRGPIEDMMFRTGAALVRFHRQNARAANFRVGSILGKIDWFCQRLRALGVDPAFQDRVVATLRAWADQEIPTHITSTLKGLDIRNVLAGRDGRQLFLVDPGRIKEDVQESDVARFLATVRILHWGNLRFCLRRAPGRSYESAFLRGYYGDGEPRRAVLTVMLVKELLKHWSIAYVALGLKRWPGSVSQIVRRIYIDPFFHGQIARELDALAG